MPHLPDGRDGQQIRDEAHELEYDAGPLVARLPGHGHHGGGEDLPTAVVEVVLGEGTEPAARRDIDPTPNDCMKHIKVPPKGSPLFNLNDGRVGCNRGSSNGGLGVQLPVLHAEHWIKQVKQPHDDASHDLRDRRKWTGSGGGPWASPRRTQGHHPTHPPTHVHNASSRGSTWRPLGSAWRTGPRWLGRPWQTVQAQRRARTTHGGGVAT